VLFTGLLLYVVPAAAEIDEPYGVEPIAEPSYELISREWRKMPRKFLADAAALTACRRHRDSCTSAMLMLIKVIDKVIEAKKKMNDIGVANEEVNRLLIYTTDLEQWGNTDGTKEKPASEVWSGPIEAVESGRGDCDEYYNIKYFVLWQAGVDTRLLRPAILDYGSGEMHIVLTVKSANWFVMDFGLQLAVRPKAVYTFLPYDLSVPSVIAKTQATAR
jgi:predicted transglutaminase-like cysteine proteinase